MSHIKVKQIRFKQPRVLSVEVEPVRGRLYSWMLGVAFTRTQDTVLRSKAWYKYGRCVKIVSEAL